MIGAEKYGERWLRLARNPIQIRDAVLRRLPGVLKVGERATCKRVRRPSYRGMVSLKKEFRPTEEGMLCLENELLARRIFGDRPWMLPLLSTGPTSFTVPMLPDETRLDRLSPQLDEHTRLEIARQIVFALFDIFLAGYAHRDCHAGNLFWVEGQIVFTDFEFLANYPSGQRPSFPESYDITGNGLDSPSTTANMCYSPQRRNRFSIQDVLGISVERALETVTDKLKCDLQTVTKTFKTQGNPHMCRTGRVYGSFSLPFFSVSEEEAQRNSALRMQDMRITEGVLLGKSLLDIGCNIGGMFFESLRFNPSHCLGIEFDPDKVELARKVAAYNGLNNVRFEQGDIEKITVEELGGKFDIVYCLALEAHIANKKRFYNLLSEATSETLFFEGNSTTDRVAAERNLLDSGFRRVDYLGMSQDDCLPKNNCRPMFIAKK